MIPKNKSIAILHPYVNKVGGAVKMMIYLSNFLQEKNDIIFYTFSYNEKLFYGEINFKIKSYFSNKLLKLLSFFQIAFSIRKVDYIIIGNSPMHFVGVLSKILFFSKAKIIWWNHHYPWYYKNNTNLFIKLKRYIEKLFVKKIDIILSNSKSVKIFIDKIWNIDSKILYPIVDKSFVAKDFSPERENIIFSYGRWVEGKNLQLIFKTYEELKNKISDLVLIIGGYGEELEYFKIKYKNNSNVKILGRLVKKQILENLYLSKVFLFPSLIDSFGLVKLEAMSTGNPVVCLDNFGDEEIVINDFNGFCVKSENDFIEKTNLLLTNSELRNKLSKNAIQLSKNFSGDIFYNQLEDIF